MARKSFSFDLDSLGIGTVIVVLVNGTTLTGTLVRTRHHHNDCPPLEVNVEGTVEVEVEQNFILLTLSTAYPETGTVIFPAGSVVAINTQLILFIGPVQI